MKHRREGTLEEWEFSTDDGDDFEEAARVADQVGISGLDDFLAKADRLAEEMHCSGPLRAKRARRLRHAANRIRAALAAGAGASILYNAIGAGLTYANLVNELRMETQTRASFTRSEYFAAKKSARNRAELAEALGGISDQALRKWERDHVKSQP
jgi:hypothetical protein